MTSLRGVTRARDQSSVTLAGKDFQKSGPKQSEKCSALVEDFNYESKPPMPFTFRVKGHLTQLNMPKVCLDETIESCLKVVCCRRLCRRRGKSTKCWRMAGIEHLQLTELDYDFPNIIKVSYPLMLNFESFCSFIGFAVKFLWLWRTSSWNGVGMKRV